MKRKIGGGFAASEPLPMLRFLSDLKVSSPGGR